MKSAAGEERSGESLWWHGGRVEKEWSEGRQGGEGKRKRGRR